MDARLVYALFFSRRMEQEEICYVMFLFVIVWWIDTSCKRMLIVYSSSYGKDKGMLWSMGENMSTMHGVCIEKGVGERGSECEWSKKNASDTVLEPKRYARICMLLGSSANESTLSTLGCACASSASGAEWRRMIACVPQPRYLRPQSEEPMGFFLE
jgi:hypothetical protein